jgi:hypothetical protein
MFPAVTGPARKLTVTNVSEGSVFVVRHHRDFVEVALLQLGEEVWRIHFGLLVRPDLLPAGEQLLRFRVVADRVPHRIDFQASGETALPKKSGD